MTLFTALLLSREGSAAPKFVSSFQAYCASLLRNAGPAAARDGLPRDLKSIYNKDSLKSGRALLLSEQTRTIRLKRGASTDWIEHIMKTSVDFILDSNLPRWREDGDWYFQPAHEIKLYNRSGDLMIFAVGSVVLMNEWFPTGQVFLGRHPQLELLD